MVQNLEVYETVKPPYCWTEDEVGKLKRLYESTEVEKIAKLLGRSKDAVWSKADRMDLKRIDSKLIQPYLVPSETLCYILGVLKGDGSVYTSKKYRHVIRLQVKDKLFADSFKKALKEIGLHPYYHYEESDDRPGHNIYAHSKIFVAWYSALTLGNIGNMLINPRFGISFIRGFYESEGSFHHKWREERHQYSWKLALYNNDESLLRMVQSILAVLGFNFNWEKPVLHKPHMFRGYVIITRKPVCYIQIQSKENILDFLSLINPCIKGQKMKEID